MKLGIGVGLWQYHRVASGWSPASLSPLFWAGSLDPVSGRMWQDSAGVTPVTAAGQPVGLLFDAVNGGNRGPETSSSGWDGDFVQASSGGGFDGSKPSAGGLARAYTTNTFSAKNGAWYEVTVDVTSTTLPRFAISLSQTTDGRSTSATVTGAGLKKVYVRGTNPAPAASINVSTADVGLITVASASVCEVLAIVAFQATALSRPTLRQSGAVWYLEDDGGDSLPAIFPAGSLHLAYVNELGAVSYTTATSDGTTGVDLLLAERMADVIVLDRAFTSDEEAKIEAYWARYAA